MIQASMCVTCAGQELTLDIEWKRDVYNSLKKQKLVFFPGEIELNNHSACPTLIFTLSHKADQNFWCI